MGNYVEKNLGAQENIIRSGKISGVVLVPHIILMFFVIGIFTIWKPLITMLTTELAYTNKNLYGKTGLIKTQAMTSPLNKIQNVKVSSGLFGKIFKYGTISITTTSGVYSFEYIKDAEGFKTALMNQIDLFDEERIRKQAESLASAIKQD